jgi:hypothetical protein
VSRISTGPDLAAPCGIPQALIGVAGDFDDAEFAMLFFVRPIDRSPKDRIIPDASMEFLSDPARF